MVCGQAVTQDQGFQPNFKIFFINSGGNIMMIDPCAHPLHMIVVQNCAHIWFGCIVPRISAKYQNLGHHFRRSVCEKFLSTRTYPSSYHSKLLHGVLESISLSPLKQRGVQNCSKQCFWVDTTAVVSAPIFLVQCSLYPYPTNNAQIKQPTNRDNNDEEVDEDDSMAAHLWSLATEVAASMVLAAIVFDWVG